MARRKRNIKAYEAVKQRSSGICERCKSAEAVNHHHRRLRSAGGGDSLLNLVHLCFACHHWAHHAGEEAYREGWLISPKYHGHDVARLYEVDD